MDTKTRKQKVARTPRGMAEGNSVVKKHKTPAAKAGKTSDGGKKVHRKHKLEKEYDVDDPSFPVAPKRLRHGSESESDASDDMEIDVDESIMPQIEKQMKAKKAKKTAKKMHEDEENMETEPTKADVSWEKAVERARGLPDGAMKDADGDDDGSENEEENTSPVKAKSTQYEKGKKKPLSILTTAAKKLKQISSGCAGEMPGEKKRKSHDGEKAEDEEKIKPEHMKKKDRKVMRQSKDNTNYELAAKAKSLWNELRRMDLKNERRVELSNQLYAMIKGKTQKLIFAHDTSRVIQCLIKYGTQTHKDAVFEELKGDIVELCKSQYAKFFVRRLLKYGSKAQRDHVFNSFYGNVRKLIRHKNACEILEVAYNDYANAQQRTALVEEFYGPSFALFKTGEVKTLQDIMEANPEKRDTILGNMKESLTVLAEKAVLQYSIVHRVFWEYFMFASAKQRADMIEALREGLIHMLHTRDGARVAMFCIWHGTAKDRKLIVKSMKTYVVKICKEEHGHLVLLALFDAVDDTKLVSKAILDELLKSVMDVTTDQYGRKVILYLLARRDTKHFHPDIIKVLKQGDDNQNSKKETAVRQSELLEHVSKPLVKFVADNASTLVTDMALVVLVHAIIAKAKGDPTLAMRAVAMLAAEPFTSTGKEEGQHIVERAAGHLTLKRLILNDAERMKDGQEVLFSVILLDVLPDGALKSWAACNRGCFTLCLLIELNHPDVSVKVKKALHSLSASLKKMEFKGAHVLLSKLQ